MVAASKIVLPLPATVPGQPPEEVYQQLNDLYLAFNNLLLQLNNSSPVTQSPNGHYWKGSISNTGVLTWTDVGTLRP